MRSTWKRSRTQMGPGLVFQSRYPHHSSQAQCANCADEDRSRHLPDGEDQTMQTMRANVFRGPNKIGIQEVPRPSAGVGEAVIRITLTTICGTDLHILRGEYPVKLGLVIGHEPVGVIEELGEGLSGYKIGDRVLVGAITPCGQCRACLSAQWAQCGHGEGVEAIGGWRFGNTINGAQAEYLLVPNAQANLAKIPDELTGKQVVLLADIASTGFSGAESANIRIGDTFRFLPRDRLACAPPRARNLLALRSSS